MTCQYRCANACDHPAPNTSDNPYFGDLLAKAISRRGVFKVGAAGALVVGAGVGAGTAIAGIERPGSPSTPAGAGGLTFQPVPPNTLDKVSIPDGYRQHLVIEWGDPVVPGAPPFDIDNQSGDAQEKQFGYNNDYLAVIPLDKDFTRALLVSNHEYTNEELMFPGYEGPDSLTVDQVKAAIAAHGMSVVELKRSGRTGKWEMKKGKRSYNRRFTLLSTKFQVDGPAAGHDLLKTAADPAGEVVFGTINNCSGGLTPWGTVLSGEENFNQYFVGGDGAPEELKTSLKRYGIDVTTRYPDGNRKWDRADERWDLTKTPNEAHRFGWVVEIDPFEPTSAPRKHTALGRLKHEGANVIIAGDGRVVAYTGDDERFDYLYKFVSHKKYRDGDSKEVRSHNKTLLESGDLYVAKFGFTSADEIDGSGKLPSDGAFDGTGTWLPLVKDGESQVDGMSVAEVLIYTRLAADKAGATKMDRPEDVEPNPHTGKVYAALTNNTDRGAAGKAAADEVNPRNSNKHGQVLEITEDDGDQTSETFTWELPLVCGDPEDPSTYFAGYDKSKVSPISCPDNVAFDAYGNLWLSTDGNKLGSHDGLFAVPLVGDERGHLKQFLSVPIGAETCGPFITKDNRSVFVAVQHPGEVDGATVENPASTWPHGEYAKPGVVCTWHADGDEIGT
ncbi:MAG: PhoX family protein [Micromonosporaceae bacterium]